MSYEAEREIVLKVLAKTTLCSAHLFASTWNTRSVSSFARMYSNTSFCVGTADTTARSRDARAVMGLGLAIGRATPYITHVACMEDRARVLERRSCSSPLQRDSMSRRQVTNQLLRRLRVRDRARLGPLERVELSLHQPLESADALIEYVYFFEQGFASVVADASDADPIEIGLIGREGMTGSAILLGDTRSPFDTFVQGAGSASRMEAAQLRRALAASPSLRAVFLGYVRTFLTQVASTAAANGRSSISERLGRWLLMVQDRLGSSFPITHEFLGIMLAVQRPGVTLALQSLEASGLIRATRGNVEITDRPSLIASTNGAYGVPEREYLRLFPT